MICCTALPYQMSLHCSAPLKLYCQPCKRSLVSWSLFAQCTGYNVQDMLCTLCTVQCVHSAICTGTLSSVCIKGQQKVKARIHYRHYALPGGTVLHCCTAALLQCCTAALLHCYIAALLHCCIAALLHCCTAALLHCWQLILFRNYFLGNPWAKTSNDRYFS